MYIIKMNILVIAAHPDDEVLGMGGTIKKLSGSNEISLCVISEGASAQYKNKKMIKVRREACKKCGKKLGIKNFYFLNFPDMKLDSIPQLTINQKIEKIIKKVKPEIVFTTPSNDLNSDHRRVFESTLVATRPIRNSVKKILSYEIPGVVYFPFKPNTYENILREFNCKIDAFKEYKTEIEDFPHPRSIESIKNLSIMRGIESGLKRAEAFMLIRDIKK